MAGIIFRKNLVKCPPKPRIYSNLISSDDTWPLYQLTWANRHEDMTIWRCVSNCSTLSSFSRCNNQFFWLTPYQTSRRSNDLHNLVLLPVWCLLVRVDLWTNQNGPIDKNLWQYEDVGPTLFLIQMQQPTNIHTELYRTNHRSNDLHNRGFFSFLVFSDRGWPLHRTKWTNRRKVMAIWICVSNCSTLSSSRWSTFTLPFVQLLLMCRCLLMSSFSCLG